MRTDTLKLAISSIFVGLLFAIPLNINAMMKTGIIANIGQLLYMFTILGGTYFLTGMINNRRGRKTTNMRIFAKKMRNEGILILDAQAQMVNEGFRPTKGWLYLTNKFVIFANTSDPELIEKKAIRMSLAKISKLETFKPTPITNDGLRIKMQKGQEYDIYVGKSQDWIDAINNAKNNKSKNKDNK